MIYEIPLSCSYIPDTTKVDEISVPAQKYVGGYTFEYIKATIHGKSPLVKLLPLTMRPELILGTPQAAVLLRDRLELTIAMIAQTKMRTKMFPAFGFILKVKRSS